MSLLFFVVSLLNFVPTDSNLYQNFYTFTATQIDKRRTNPQCVTELEGRELSRKIGAATYVECSAKTNQGVPDAIHTAVTTAVYSHKEPTPKNRETKQTMPVQGVEKEDDIKNNCIFCCF